MERKNLKRIEAVVAISGVLAVILILITGPALIAAPDDPYPTYVGHAWVSLHATDASGVQYINYSIVCSDPAGSVGWTQVMGDTVSPFEVTTAGTYTVQYYAVDTLGNVEVMKLNSFIVSETNPPITTLTVTQDHP